MDTPVDALFLPGDDDETGLNATRVPAPDPETEKMFQDIEDIPNEFDELPDIGPKIDSSAIERRAAAKSKQKTSAISYPTPSSPVAASSSPTKKDDKPTKPRKKPMQLNEVLLIGETGFPQLIKDTEGFRIQGKGHEVRALDSSIRWDTLLIRRIKAADLARLLQVYQFWSHRMYPKTQFKDTVQRVEKLCHSNHMHVRSFLCML